MSVTSKISAQKAVKTGVGGVPFAGEEAQHVATLSWSLKLYILRRKSRCHRATTRQVQSCAQVSTEGEESLILPPKASS